MKWIRKNIIKLLSALLGLALLPVANAHLMVAQHGTLNFLDDSVYLVLSVPVTAFSDTDEDGDGKLSVAEFTQHRSELIDIVAQKVSLRDKTGDRPMQDILVSPVTPHGAPNMPADQLIVMGQFKLQDASGELYFHVDLYGSQATQQFLEITATDKAAKRKDVFKLSPESAQRVLFAAKK